MSRNIRYIIVIDFEATCDDQKKIRPQEIIEFPVVVVDLHEGRIVHESQRYVRPTAHPILTPFCTQLTGIHQDQVTPAQPINEVLAQVVQEIEGLGYVDEGLPLTCGDWDLLQMLPLEAKTKKLPVPAWLQSWANIKVLFREWYPRYRPSSRANLERMGMTTMLEAVGLPLVGRHHSGIDDSRNIAQIVLLMAQNGCRFRATRALN